MPIFAFNHLDWEGDFCAYIPRKCEVMKDSNGNSDNDLGQSPNDRTSSLQTAEHLDKSVEIALDGLAAMRPSHSGEKRLGEQPGDIIDRYRLIRIIGEGGMGEVWLAEQFEPVNRQVALKILKLGMDTKRIVARFEAERQALAMMKHPNIANIYDGGATPSGRPYFVMEYVEGETIARRSPPTMKCLPQ